MHLLYILGNRGGDIGRGGGGGGGIISYPPVPPVTGSTKKHSIDWYALPAVFDNATTTCQRYCWYGLGSVPLKKKHLRDSIVGCPTIGLVALRYPQITVKVLIFRIGQTEKFYKRKSREMLKPHNIYILRFAHAVHGRGVVSKSSSLPTYSPYHIVASGDESKEKTDMVVIKCNHNNTSNCPSHLLSRVSIIG
ncbi:LOW QUALITY PROTEIN: hypothetical protein BC937DRAFT_87592 [Endogone sp. FLAS-F59071]|nr:LOW QUALITY PROTEIN: hypothetical protein BC937DRAFT_87592 [Endogone sp. FLAS-F59071]|eukprot:RUS19362.1 LOW QUALITY PROTEIN: hypothetical protein BC937DRAFT_87592 [Endogone sp. FLAS-F59071]